MGPRSQAGSTQEVLILGNGSSGAFVIKIDVLFSLIDSEMIEIEMPP